MIRSYPLYQCILLKFGDFLSLEFSVSLIQIGLVLQVYCIYYGLRISISRVFLLCLVRLFHIFPFPLG